MRRMRRRKAKAAKRSRKLERRLARLLVQSEPTGMSAGEAKDKRTQEYRGLGLTVRWQAWGKYTCEEVPVDSLAKALWVARKRMEAGALKSVGIWQAGAELCDSIEIERQTGVGEQGEVVVLPPGWNPYWDEAFAYEQQRGGLCGASPRSWQRLTDTYAYAIPGWTDLAFVARHLGARAVSMGAGNGYWECLLQQMGVEITAYDREPCTGPRLALPLVVGVWTPQQGYGLPLDGCWYPVAQGTPAVIGQHAQDALFLNFPPGENAMALECLEAYRGKSVVVIGGEGDGVGTSAFYRKLAAEWERREERTVCAASYLGGTTMVAYRRRA